MFFYHYPSLSLSLSVLGGLNAFLFRRAWTKGFEAMGTWQWACKVCHLIHDNPLLSTCRTPSCKTPHTPTSETQIARRLLRPGPRSPSRTVYVPCLRPSAGSSQVQPASQLGHLQCHGHGLHVFGVRSSLAPPSPICSVSYLQSLALSTACRLCTTIAPRVPL